MNSFYLTLEKDNNLFHIIVQGDWEWYSNEAKKRGFKLRNLESNITKDRIKELKNSKNYIL